MAEAARQLMDIVYYCYSLDPTDDAALREKETALVELGKLYRDQKCVASGTPTIR